MINDPCSDPIMESEVVFPSVTVNVMDQSQEAEYTFSPNMTEIYVPKPVYKEEGWRRHNGGANYLFCDGHVKWYEAHQVQPAQPSGGGENINDGTKPTFSIKTK